MKIEDLKDNGVYVLTRDVKNPKPDRRMSRKWTASPVFKAGTRIVCQTEPYLTLGAAGYCDTMSKTFDEEALPLVVAALEEAPETFENVMLSINGPTWSIDCAQIILDEMALSGKITLQDIREAYAQHRERSRREYAEKKAGDAVLVAEQARTGKVDARFLPKPADADRPHRHCGCAGDCDKWKPCPKAENCGHAPSLP